MKTRRNIPTESARIVSARTLKGLSLLALSIWQVSALAEPAACDASGCQQDGEYLFRVSSRGLEQPLTDGVAAGSRALAPDRRVSIARPGRATAVGRFALDLPNGGVIWATEDPALIPPVLNVNGLSLVAFEEGRIAEPVRFSTYSNYTGFIERMELVIYHGRDNDLLTPLATLPLQPANAQDVMWDGTVVPGSRVLREGDDLQYVLRAWSADGSLDETWPRRLQLVRQEERERSRQQQQFNSDASQRGLSASELESRLLTDNTYGQNALRIQNIAIYGSRVRVLGQDLPKGYSLNINGESIPVDTERKFVAEYLLPVGEHGFDLVLGQGEKAIEHRLDMNVSGRYLFLTAIADVTASQNRISGSVEPLNESDRYDDFLVEGRLGFYLKGKVRGKYLITAHADTQEREVGDLFSGFFEADPQDIFRRLDPDAYYPVYGDDSTTWRDVDTQGRLYVRVDWDQNQALWGNFQTGLTGTEYSQYVRSLYGGALQWRSRSSTDLGEAHTQLRVFASEAQTAFGHTEFLGTGGSLYYLRHTDVLPGSEQVVLEVRDGLTGRAEARVTLVEGVDYEIDDMQGRIILSAPLAQISRQNLPSLTRDTPLGGYQNILLVDYEYVLRGFDGDDVTAGIRGKQWIGDHVAVGATFVEEQRAGDDYRVMGADLTLQAGRGTYLKLEHAKTESAVAPLFYSDNGGLSFRQLNSLGRRDGEASSLEARLNLKEQGWTDEEWTVAGWWRDVGDGYSISRFDTGERVREQGMEFLGHLNAHWVLSGRWSEARRGDSALDQQLLRLDWLLDDHSLSGELRGVQETRSGLSADGVLAAVQYTHRLNSALEVYGIAQLTVDDDGGAYRDNDAYTLGARYLFGNLSSVGAELTSGDRGDAATVSAEYRMSQDHSVYAGYTWVTDSTETDPLFRGHEPGGLTLGQRWRLSDQVNLFNESQWLKSGPDTGIAHTFGMDFYPGDNWNLGFTLQDGKLETPAGNVDRNAVTLRGGRTTSDTSWSSTVEFRRDSGAEQREQWVSTHRLLHKINDAWRVAARLNWSDTDDKRNPEAGARFTEANLGFSWRPVDGTRWAMLGKYTYLYDLSSLGQLESSSQYDQRSQILAFEGIYRIDQRWELAGKLASRLGEARLGRGTGSWYDSRADFAAIQARYRLYEHWSGLAEYRWLDTKNGGTRQGFLIGVDRDIGRNFRIGAGYNFTDFSDDLRRHDYDYRGWFLNIVGYY